VTSKRNEAQESSCSSRHAQLLPTIALQQQTPLKHQEHSTLKNDNGRITQGYKKQLVYQKCFD